MASDCITNARSFCSIMVDNATLNRYFSDHVPVEKEKTTRIGEEVLPDLDAILDYVNRQDKHFGKTGIRVGSSTQGLNVDGKGDVDCNVVFKINPNESEDHPSNRFVWVSTPLKHRYYGFQAPTPNDTSSLSEDIRIVVMQNSLPSPETGYYYLGNFSASNQSSVGLAEFIFQEDLIPFLVKRKFKRLLLEASKDPRLTNNMKLSTISHGPALTFKAEVTMSDGDPYSVSIDLAVAIRARLPFLPKMGWPVPSWPSQEKIDSIQKLGINLVAKKPFDWQLSFSELEKELVREIDKDGGCRKDVHRIMKSVYYTVCKTDAALSTYVLKNAWFLELEKHPDPKCWQPQHLSLRYYGCLESLLTFVNNGSLPQYFNRQINLLKMEKIWDIRNDVANIRNFQFDQRKRPANNGPLDAHIAQPFKKTKATACNM